MATDGSRAAERLLAGCGATRLDAAAAAEHADPWRRTFSIELQRALGTWTLAGFDWHSFSYQMVHALAGEPARAEYRHQEAARAFYVDELGFEIRADITMGNFRWLTVAPKGQPERRAESTRVRSRSTRAGAPGTDRRWSRVPCRIPP